MIKRVQRIAPHQAGKVLGVLYFIMGCVFVPFFILASLFDKSGGGVGVVFGILIPVLYGVLGYVFVALGALVYNLVAGFVGGLEITLDDGPR